MLKIFSDLDLKKVRPICVNEHSGNCIDCNNKVWHGKGFVYRNFDPAVKRKYDIRCVSCANILLNKRRE